MKKIKFILGRLSAVTTPTQISTVVQPNPVQQNKPMKSTTSSSTVDNDPLSDLLK